MERNELDKIAALAAEIRELVNQTNTFHCRHLNLGIQDWNALCDAMDTLEDSTSALRYYELLGHVETVHVPNALDTKWHDSFLLACGEKYLKLYGFFQAVILQQDSIRRLHKIFKGMDLKRSGKTAWMKLREARHLVSGHPIERAAAVSRGTLGKHELHVFVYERNKVRMKLVRIRRLFDSYKTAARRHLQDIRKATNQKCTALNASGSFADQKVQP
jgi:hypothetical protein